MPSKKKNIYIFLSKVIIVTLLIVLCVRTFWVEPYTVSSVQMETYLTEGDKILIDKTAYGIRLPTTILSIPFTFDNIFGLKAYSTAIEFPYKRIFEKEILRNDVVLFNNPTEIEKPLDKRSLLLSRCIAIPGDSVLVQNGIFLINGKQYAVSPDVIGEYIIKPEDIDNILGIIEDQDITPRSIMQQSDTLSIQLSKLEAFIINQYLPDSLSLINKIDTTQSYQFSIPSRGNIVNIDARSLILYKQIIVQEQGEKAKFTDGKLFINGKEQAKYSFEDDYYWMLSDNTLNSTDSRTLGFIPLKSVIGKARFIWYNSLKNSFCFSSLD